jgi:hypothetical protein
MTQREWRQRRARIIRQLSELSREGWAHAKEDDYRPLERELHGIDAWYFQIEHNRGESSTIEGR